MEGLKPPRTLKFYQLTKLSMTSGLYITPAGIGTGTIGSGIFKTLDEAEQNRTMEMPTSWVPYCIVMQKVPAVIHE